MTNADKIRTMTDAELEAFLTKIAGGGMEWFYSRSCNLCQEKHGGKCPTGESDICLTSFDSDVMDYLTAPADE